MTKKTTASPADYIQPLNMNGLHGRVMHVPAPPDSNTEILLVYGHHAKLERWWGLVQNFNDCAAVTMPDLPGFGGMDNFAKVGKKPTIDNYADYLAAFITLRYKHKRVSIAAISFGFAVVTRMLQRYPDLVKKVDLVISIVGFMHQDDFLFPPRKQRLYSVVTGVFATPPIPFLIRYCALSKLVIKNLYVRLPAGKRRFLDMDPEEFNLMMDFEVQLWQINDVRTHWATTSEFLKINNCRQPIDLPVWHVSSKHDHYFNNDAVEQHMRIVFNDYHRSVMNSKAHTPSIIADKKGLAMMFPPELRRALKAASKS